MNKLFPVLIVLLVLNACASTGGSKGGFDSLNDAITESGRQISGELEGKTVAVVSFNSPSRQFSDYVMGELSAELSRSRGLTVVERISLESVRDELQLNLSGDVSDESAQAVGKMLGAGTVITGTLADAGNAWRFRLKAINVESAAIESAPAFNISKKDPTAALYLSNVPGTTAASSGAASSMSVQTHFSRGESFISQGIWTGAIQEYSEIIKQDPQDNVAYNNRGAAQIASGNNNGGINDLSEAIRLNPNSAVAYNNRGTAYYNIRDFDRAIMDLTEAIRLNPNYATAYLWRGLAYQEKGDTARANADFRRATP